MARVIAKGVVRGCAIEGLFLRTVRKELLATLNRQEAEGYYVAAGGSRDRQLCIRLSQAMTRPLQKTSLDHTCPEKYLETHRHRMSWKKVRVSNGRYAEAHLNNVYIRDVAGIIHPTEIFAR